MSPTDGVGGCVVQSVVTEVEDSLPPLPLTRDALIKAQRSDPSLVKCFDAVNDSEFCGSQSFMIQDAMLMRKWVSHLREENEEWSTLYQIVVPVGVKQHGSELAHKHLWSAHLGF